MSAQSEMNTGIKHLRQQCHLRGALLLLRQGTGFDLALPMIKQWLPRIVQ